MATTGTVLTYNGYTIASDIKTVSVSFEPENSDDGVDKLYTRCTIQIVGILNTSLPPANANATVADCIASIRECIMQKRKTLELKVNGVSMVSSPANGKSSDAKWGPEPQVFEVKEIHGHTTFIVGYKIVTWLAECCSGNSQLKPVTQAVLSNRWEQTAEIDQDWYTRLTTTGTLVVLGGNNNNPDDFRNVVTTKVPDGFVRELANYVVTSDGLRLRYTFVDKQVLHSPPKGCTRWEGSCGVTTTDAVKVFQEAEVKLWGNSKADKNQLYKTAISMCIQALVGAGKVGIGNVKNIIFQGGTLHHLMHENMVQVRIRQMITPNGGGAKKANLSEQITDPNKVALVDNYDTPGNRGTLLLKLIAPAFADPCLNQSLAASVGQGSGTQAGSTAAPEANIQVVSNAQNAITPDD